MPLPSPASHEAPIGVFDSGIGGLTVVRALMSRLPHEDILYFGDTARVPYGVKSPETIRHYAAQITGFLLGHGVKMLIIACNSMAAVAGDTVRAQSALPVLDVIAAGAREALRVSRNRHIGVIGTLATVNSRAYEQAIGALDPGATVLARACPLLVPLAEEGWLDHPATRLVATEYLHDLKSTGPARPAPDTLVLGCTHYPLLKPLISAVMGTQVTLVDSAEAIAEEAAETLERQALAAPLGRDRARRGSLKCFVTDVPQRFQTVGERFLGHTLPGIELVAWD